VDKGKKKNPHKQIFSQQNNISILLNPWIYISKGTQVRIYKKAPPKGRAETLKQVLPKTYLQL
jgi:hypothetical protein